MVTFQKAPTARTRPVLLLLYALMVPTFVTSVPLASVAKAQEKRVLENTIPKHVPLKVEIKKAKRESFEDLKNDKWVRELELEITNTSEKPIYFLYMSLVTNVAPGIEVLIDDSVREGRLGLTIFYGRAELGDLVSKPAPEDVPIKPGEIFTFTVHPGEVGGWEMAIRDHMHPQPTNIKIVFQSLSFGDGTGLLSSGGSPYPAPRKP